MALGQFPIDDLVAIGSDLERLEQDLTVPEVEVEGVGTQQQLAATDALNDFHEEWKPICKLLVQNIGHWGTTAGMIGNKSASIDDEGRAEFAKLTDMASAAS